MKKTFFTVICVAVLASAAFAHPPATIEADYLINEGKLYVYMEHLSRDHRDHYIRKTSISLNGEEVAVQNNRQQIDPTSYGFAVGLEANAGDEITLKAYCAEGGTKSLTITVPKEEQAKEQSTVKAKVESYTMERDNVGVYDSKEDVYDSKEEVMDSQTDPYGHDSDDNGSGY